MSDAGGGHRGRADEGGAQDEKETATCQDCAEQDALYGSEVYGVAGAGGRDGRGRRWEVGKGFREGFITDSEAMEIATRGEGCAAWDALKAIGIEGFEVFVGKKFHTENHWRNLNIIQSVYSKFKVFGGGGGEVGQDFRTNEKEENRKFGSRWIELIASTRLGWMIRQICPGMLYDSWVFTQSLCSIGLV